MNYDKVNECYKKLIAIGRKSNNASLVAALTRTSSSGPIQ